MTLHELEQLMRQRWDKDQYGSFKIGRPTSASIEKCILLPATHRNLVIVYPRAADGLFSKENKVSVATADTPEGARLATAEHSPTRGPPAKLWQTSSILSAEKERSRPAEEVLQAYAAHTRDALQRSGSSSSHAIPL